MHTSGRPSVCMQMQMRIPDMVNHPHQVRCRRQVEFSARRRTGSLTSPSVPSSDVHTVRIMI